MLATPGRNRLGPIVVSTGERRLFAVPPGFEIRFYRRAGDGKGLIPRAGALHVAAHGL